MNSLKSRFLETGWCKFSFDAALAAWVNHVLPACRACVTSPDNAQWLRCGGTWFVGVNALPNDEAGSVDGSGPIGGEAVEFIRNELRVRDFRWDRGQVSVCYPNYPQPMPTESCAAFAYRRDRDAAHVDGLLPEGSRRRRHLREHHGFILGLPLVEVDAQASPFVVWEGSHELVRDALERRFAGLAPALWGDEDVTAAYHEARNRVFQQCHRVEVAAKPGEAYLAHRLVVHGVAPWSSTAEEVTQGRMVCYFRPEVGGPADWLRAP